MAYDPVVAEMIEVGRRVTVAGQDWEDTGRIEGVLADTIGRPVLLVLDSDTSGRTGYRWGAIDRIRPAGPLHPALA